jgi:hypothetical protein
MGCLGGSRRRHFLEKPYVFPLSIFKVQILAGMITGVFAKTLSNCGCSDWAGRGDGRGYV